VANPQLSLKQFAAIALGQTEPPWHLGQILKPYGQAFLDVRRSLANLSKTTAVLAVCVRSASAVAKALAEAMNTPVDTGGGQKGVLITSIWTQLWSSPTFVLKSDLQALQSILSPIGAGIVYLSPATAPSGMNQMYVPAWVTVGIAGPIGGLASLNSQVLPFAPAEWTADQWKTISGLKSGVVLVDAQGGSTASPMDYGSTYLDPSDKPGPAIQKMVVLSGA